MKQSRVKTRWGERLVADFAEPKKPGEEAALRLYLHYLGVLAEMGWTVEAKALQEHLVMDEEFQDNAADILAVNMQGPHWIDKFFKVTAERALAAMAEREKTAYAENTQFGMF